jgi:hypothetical protein
MSITGNVYKIIADNDETQMVYIGSTLQKQLSARMKNHRDDYTAYKKGTKPNFTSSFILFDEFGIQNCKIVLLQSYEVSSKDELRAKEQEWIDKIPNCNKYKAFLTEEQKKEYRLNYDNQYAIDNREKIAERHKVYAEKHKEEIATYQEQYRADNHEKLLADKKADYQKNKEKYLASQAEKVICICGLTLSRGNLPAHERSQQHLDFVNGVEKDTRSYYERNKEKVKAQVNQRRIENIDKIKARKTEKLECDCGETYTRDNYARHCKSQKHQNHKKVS